MQCAHDENVKLQRAERSGARDTVAHTTTKRAHATYAFHDVQTAPPTSSGRVSCPSIMHLHTGQHRAAMKSWWVRESVRARVPDDVVRIVESCATAAIPAAAAPQPTEIHRGLHEIAPAW
ncbi:hypothetical protein EON66_09875 [archaeon]|nr:MAG: hypothetical protein EON66_09875 [archaeon]